jgi:uncharacterized membrane protein
MITRKNLLISVLIVSLLISTSLSAVYAEDRSFTIPFINIDLYPQEDGTLHVKETIHYSFSGTYNGIYRDIPLKEGEYLENIKVTTPGVYPRLELSNGTDYGRITVYLYSDPQMTTPITDRDVDVIIEYDFIHTLKFYNDVVELHYKLIGELWEVDIGKVNANIHLNSSEGVKYWLNPPYFTESSNWQGNTLQVTGKTVPTGEYYEIRMVIPKDQFAANPTGGIIINQDGLPQIEKIQNDYQNDLNFWTFLYSLVTVLMLLACLVPFIIYLLFGREPKIDYQAEYERDLPTDDPPAIVNAIVSSGKVGDPDMDGFKATIMDLIDRKYLLFHSAPSGKEDVGLSGDMTFKINPDKNLSELKKFERHLITDFLKGFEEDGVISLDNISSDMSDRKKAKDFLNTYNDWRDSIKKEFIGDDVLKKIFNKKGDVILKAFGGIAIIIAGIVFISTILMGIFIPGALSALIASIILGIVAIASLILPQRIAGQWTTYGEEYDAKWQNFKKYIQDFSLIKEYPPESVVIWNKYLVYATALGVADAVRKAMEISLPADELNSSDIYVFHSTGGYALMTSSLSTGVTTASAGNGSGGVGGVGGGSGGGGGGAF